MAILWIVDVRVDPPLIRAAVSVIYSNDISIEHTSNILVNFLGSVYGSLKRWERSILTNLVHKLILWLDWMQRMIRTLVCGQYKTNIYVGGRLVSGATLQGGSFPA